MNPSRWLSAFLLLIGTAFPQGYKPCDSNVAFVDRNMIDNTVTIRSVRGSITDSTGVSVPKDCVALFTPDRSKLLRTVEANDSGEFVMRRVKAGDYWLVVQDPQRAFCPATVRLRLRTFAPKSKILVHMEVAAIDHCSYCESR